MNRIIRLATSHDATMISFLVMESHKKSAYFWWPMAFEQVIKTVRQAISSQDAFVAVVEDNREITGFTIGAMTSVWWTHGRGATNIFTYLRPGAVDATIHLFRRFIDWAKKKDAFIVNMALSYQLGPVPESLDKILLKLGFLQAETMYILPLQGDPQCLKSLSASIPVMRQKKQKRNVLPAKAA